MVHQEPVGKDATVYTATCAVDIHNQHYWYYHLQPLATTIQLSQLCSTILCEQYQLSPCPCVTSSGLTGPS